MVTKCYRRPNPRLHADETLDRLASSNRCR